MFFVCLDSFINQKPVTKTLKRRQEKYPRPLICISAFEFDYKAFEEAPLNISFEEYRKGHWKIGNLSEEASFNQVAPKIYHLIRNNSIQLKFNHDPHPPKKIIQGLFKIDF